MCFLWVFTKRIVKSWAISRSPHQECMGQGQEGDQCNPRRNSSYKSGNFCKCLFNCYWKKHPKIIEKVSSFIHEKVFLTFQFGLIRALILCWLHSIRTLSSLSSLRVNNPFSDNLQDWCFLSKKLVMFHKFLQSKNFIYSKKPFPLLLFAFQGQYSYTAWS